MEIRRYNRKDLEEVVDLFYETVININIRDYNEKQVEAWSKSRDSLKLNSKFFEDLYTIVVTIDKKIVGYGNIDNNGYLDHLFVHKDFQGRKIASRICDELERYALEEGLSNITVDSSITAKNFFENRGYEIVNKQNVSLRGENFINYRMLKEID